MEKLKFHIINVLIKYQILYPFFKCIFIIPNCKYIFLLKLKKIPILVIKI